MTVQLELGGGELGFSLVAQAHHERPDDRCPGRGPAVDRRCPVCGLEVAGRDVPSHRTPVARQETLL